MLSDLPRSLAARYLAEFQEELPGVRDGDTESIHRARVATRRLREILPLLIDKADPLLATIRRAGRALGRVRDVDVMAELLVRAETRMPSAALVIVPARQRIASDQQRSRRRLIKRLESLAVNRLHMADGSTATFGRVRDRLMNGWRGPLCSRIGQRAEALGDAVETAGGVYFPNRIHRVRIATKKLRYAVEVAADTRTWRAGKMLRDLRQVQSSLGELHDLQVVDDLFSDLEGDRQVDGHIPDLRSALQAEIAELHRHYVARRDRLQAAAAACTRFAETHRRSKRLGWPTRHVRPLLVASAILVPAALMLRQRPSRDSEGDEHVSEVPDLAGAPDWIGRTTSVGGA